MRPVIDLKKIVNVATQVIKQNEKEYSKTE